MLLPLTIATLLTCHVAAVLPLPLDGVQRIAFASCNKQDKPQPAWSHIDADVFVWLGDTIYADAPIVWKWRLPATVDVLHAEYARQASNTNYSAFVQRVPIVGVYDDHDYGINDGDRTWPLKREAAAAFLDFIHEPHDSPRRRQEDGIYTSYEFGAAPQRVRLLLLDVRSSRDPYDDAMQQDMLGPRQWAWLHSQLCSASPADVTIIGSGLQVLARLDPWLAEPWSRLPQSQAKLLALLAHCNVSRAFFISGDVHVGEVNAVYSDALTFPLYDFTASGLTHVWGGYIAGPVWRMLIMGATRAAPVIQVPHWGALTFDWNAADPTVTFTLHASDDGRTLLSLPISLHSLQRGAGAPLGEPFTRTPFVRMMNGLLPPPGLQVGRTLVSPQDVQACAFTDAQHGFTHECAAFMATFSPGLTWFHVVYYFAGHAAVLAFINVVLLLGGLAPCLCWCAAGSRRCACARMGMSVPNARYAAVALGVLCTAAVIRLLLAVV